MQGFGLAFEHFGLATRDTDEVAQLYCMKYSLPLTILRPTQFYDAESHCKAKQGLFYLIIDKGENGKDIIFYGENDALRNYIFLDDFSEIIAKAIQENILGIFFCPSPKSVRFSEIAKTAHRIFNRGGKIRFQKNKQKTFDLPIVSGSDLYERIGFKTSVDLAEGIRRIKYVREMK